MILLSLCFKPKRGFSCPGGFPLLGLVKTSSANSRQEGYKKPFEPLMPSASFLKYNDIDGLNAIDETTCAVFLDIENYFFWELVVGKVRMLAGGCHFYPGISFGGRFADFIERICKTTVGAGGILPQMLVVKSKGMVHPQNAQKNCSVFRNSPPGN